MAKESMAKVITEYSSVAQKMFNESDMSDSMIEVVSDMSKMIKYEIHEYLNVLNTPEAEKKIRDYVKFCHCVLLPLLDAKIMGKKSQIDKIGNMKYGLAQIPENMQEEMARYLDLRDDIYALVAFRSLKHFALFMEEDKPLEEQDWHNAGELFDGLWFHANRMILDGSVQFLEKQMFTGAGKSYSDIVMIGFILGVNIDNDCLKVFGNKVNVTPCMNSLVSYMTSRRYAKVFPYYEQFSCSEEMMFETLKKASGQLKIRGSKRPVNVLVTSKDTNISGVRAKYLFIDDITQEKDAGNMRMHESDISQFSNVWRKRYYYQDKFNIIASGTSYSVNDILSWLRNEFGAGNPKNVITHPYTEVAKCDTMKENGEAVFVKIPKLDYDTDLATFPKKYPTKQARIEREKNRDKFEAMDQQNPLPPEGTPFAYKKLETYTQIPHEESDNCWACIDPARTGKNYVCMLIFQKTLVGATYKHFLKDCVYEMRPMDDMYSFFIEKIINHRITKLHIERNTDTSLKRTLTMMLEERGVSFCSMSEIYTTKRKEDKIYDMEATILNNVVFPCEGMYANNSQMGMAMKHITSYSYKTKADFDDAPDCLAMYCEKFVMEARKLPKAQILDIRRKRY